MARARTFAALRALAERPGTPEEGIVAREMLAKLQAKREAGHSDKPEDERPMWMLFEDWLRKDISMDEFIEGMRRNVVRRKDAPIPLVVKCACGASRPLNGRCTNTAGHAEIQEEIQRRFKKGDRVYYNQWAYPVNCPAVVTGYVRPKAENGDHPWAWISIKCDHLKSSRQVPIYSEDGWHLSHEPLPEKQARTLRGDFKY